MKDGKLVEGAEIYDGGARMQNFSDSDKERLKFINDQQIKRMHYMPYTPYNIPKVR